MEDADFEPDESLSLENLNRLNDVCWRFDADLRSGNRPQIEDFLPGVPEAQRPVLKDRLAAIEAEFRAAAGGDTDPSMLDESIGSRALASQQSMTHPARIARYRVQRVLGAGGFGTVYLALDEDLNRLVAIKVPRRDRVQRLEDTTQYLDEARTLASLKHAAIVAVYDFGRTDDGSCYLVSEYVEGTDLKARIASSRPSHRESAELVAVVAEALHEAHRKRIVHRDVKPSNILLDSRGRPYLTDFGLALREETFGRSGRGAGTVVYMSPEQAREEGHLVDGRSDVFSLGVVFYEMLTGTRPFDAPSTEEVIERIKHLEARPPRQLDDSVPKELERICLKALAKRLADRYTTAQDMADDLRQFLAGDATESAATAATPAPTTLPPSAEIQHQAPVKIVPKGLRSFDAQDADFFLDLLPGPRDRNGLPESIRFWKARIEDTDAEHTFRVGLLYGPSGCGKSSLVKAGLLPRLAGHVIVVYLEATPDGTEPRILQGLRKRCPDLDDGMNLAQTIAALRRGQGLPPGKKVLIVVDQFEQWLHGCPADRRWELIEALRQCDGQRVQCLLMVRDDFWMPITDFMQQLEVPLQEGANLAAVHRFDLPHARKVLLAFGRAMGALPEKDDDLAKDQQLFLEKAAEGLAEEGTVICVRLALFAEMFKGRPWTSASLREVGGTEGIGLTFLEATFSTRTASPRYRAQGEPAQAVLKALLPEQGTDIRGAMRSHEELLRASGCREDEFSALVTILDNELRLITPTDPAGTDYREQPESPPAGKYYQLTHDYLVPSLRQWLTRKQRATRRGRAEICLAERAAVWNAKPENRHLPSLWESLAIRLLTKEMDWTGPQRRMMRAEGQHHLVRIALAAVAAALIGWAGFEGIGYLLADARVGNLGAAETSGVPAVLKDVAPYRRWAYPMLKDLVEREDVKSKERLHAALALLSLYDDEEQIEYLYEQMLLADPTAFLVICDALAGHAAARTPTLWNVLNDEKADPGRRFRAAAALAQYGSSGDAADRARWQKTATFLADRLVSSVVGDPSHFAQYLDALRPAQEALLEPLGEIFRDARRGEAARMMVANILADYAGHRADHLAEWIADADEKQFPVLFPLLAENSEEAIPALRTALQTPPQRPATDFYPSPAKRKANLAVALLRLGQGEAAWGLLRHSLDPTARSYLVNRLGLLGADPRAIIKRFEEEPDVSIRRALLLSLGEFSASQLPLDERARFAVVVLDVYRNDPDPGIHGAADWLLRQWGREPRLREMDRSLATGKPGSRPPTVVLNDLGVRVARRIVAENDADRKPAAGKAGGHRQWFLTQKEPHHTMVIIRPLKERPAPGPSKVGAKTSGPLIDHAFAISSKETTTRQFTACMRGRGLKPVVDLGRLEIAYEGVSWYEAVDYCNWLSEQDGVPRDQWCYLPNAQGKYDEGMRIAPDYLKKRGYRLPTVEEWQSACRAETTGKCPFGEATDLMVKYAWYRDNAQDHVWEPGLLKPNDFGLFDMLGNLTEWCQERAESNRTWQCPPRAASGRNPQRGRPNALREFLPPSPQGHAI